MRGIGEIKKALPTHVVRDFEFKINVFSLKHLYFFVNNKVFVKGYLNSYSAAHAEESYVVLIGLNLALQRVVLTLQAKTLI